MTTATLSLDPIAVDLASWMWTQVTTSWSMPPAVRWDR